MKYRVKKTMINLERNNIIAYYVETKEEVLKLTKMILTEGETVSCGGSVSLDETGVKELLASGKYNFLDRSKARNSAETEEIYRKTFSCDTFLTSANAITEWGELINVDGNGNRIAAITYGPKMVLFIVGVNKIVADSNEGFMRIKTTAAPLNVKRLEKETPCAKTGVCVATDLPLGAGCGSCDRICSSYLVTAYQRTRGRVRVILCGEDIGY